MAGDREALELSALQAVVTGGRGLDFDAVLARCLEQAVRLTQVNAGFIYLRDERRGRFVRAVSHAARPDLAPQTMTLDVGMPQLMTTLQLDVRDASVFTHEVHQRARDAGFPFAIIQPLRAHDRPIGFVALVSQTPTELADSTLRTLEAMANFEAVAIENARSHRDLALRARLGEMLREFAERALDIDSQVVPLLVRTAMAITRAQRGLFTRVVEKLPNQLWLRVDHVEPSANVEVPQLGSELPANEPTIARSWALSDPLVVEDTGTLDPKSPVAQLALRNGTRSFMLTTMRLGGKPVAQLYAASSEPREYSEAEVEAMRLLAAMGAQALEREGFTQELARQKTRLGAILEHLPAVVLVVDRSGQIEHMNQAGRTFAETTSSYTADWREGVRRFDIFDRDGKQVAPEDNQISKAFNGMPPVSREFTLVRGSTRIPVVSIAAPIPSEDGAIDSVVLAMQDVTAMRELADAKDRFLSIASHELRSPITSLRATTSLLQLDPSAIDDPQRRELLLGRIQRQIDRLATLMERLLDTARLGAGELPLDYSDVDLAALVRDAVEHATLTDRDHVYRCVGETKLIARCDGSRLEQVLTNLLNNACRYSPPGSSIEVILRRADVETASIDVIDHGYGITPEQLPKLFTPFFRGTAAARHKGGLGLGLYITREIVHRHAGELRVASTVGQGSTFTVDLPLSPRR